jgi:putative acetyltransferase
MSIHQEAPLNAPPQPPCAPEITIREFQSGDEASFRALNEEWITRYFRIEAKEKQILADPKGTILDRGGKIFFAIADDQPVGCCALRRISGSEYEVAKMAVTPAFQGMGVGRRLLLAVLEAARSIGARRLYLETNHILTPAIRLYESVGFKHIPPLRVIPSEYARADVYMELFFDRPPSRCS